ncbi:MAG: VWA domain-containing protein [Anaerolineae bacterium]
MTALPEHFDDDLTVADENGQGGLAVLPEDDIVVSGAWGIGFQWPEEGETGALWYDNAGGGKLRHEKVCGFRREPQLVAPALADNEIYRADTVGDVEVLCGPGPTAVATITPGPDRSATLPPTATPTEMSTRFSTATAVRTKPPTPSPTAVPMPRYLPLALREHCDPVHERSDIALVLDTSSSMTGQKIEDAKAAALAFVGLLDLAPGRSQVAVVRFDREAEVVRELTNAPALVEGAIRSQSVRSGTHIEKRGRA